MYNRDDISECLEFGGGKGKGQKDKVPAQFHVTDSWLVALNAQFTCHLFSKSSLSHKQN